jgi:NCAIR mutase (PurE)-related protein
MNAAEIRHLLDEVSRGSLRADQAHERLLQYLRQLPYEDLGFAKVDHHRSIRQGVPEVVLGMGKTPQQIQAIAERIVAAGQNLLVTRAAPEAFEAVRVSIADSVYHADARVVTVTRRTPPPGIGTIALAAAGTSDLPVAEEAAVTCEFLGNQVERVYDVGVAGLHRLIRHEATLAAARVVIVVAGMEGALPSAVGGLVQAPVIAVPTSVGYGASFGGLAALLGMLNSCASGVAVVNIDNGFGAGVIASMINHL